MTHCAALSRFKAITAIIIATLVMTGCSHSVDDERVPYCEVHLSFTTVAEWNLYGVKGDAADYRRYIEAAGITEPAGFPYKAADHTGYSGLLLVSDVLGNLIAYDLACPYDPNPAVRLEIPEGEIFARCPKCGSTFDIYTNHGNPRSGPAADRGYALQRYSVTSGGALQYRVITR